MISKLFNSLCLVLFSNAYPKSGTPAWCVLLFILISEITQATIAWNLLHRGVGSTTGRNPNNQYPNTQHTNPQVAALLTDLLQNYSHRHLHCQPPAPQMGPYFNALGLQQPPLCGPCASLGRQPPPLPGSGFNGLLPQQPQLQGVG